MSVIHRLRGRISYLSSAEVGLSALLMVLVTLSAACTSGENVAGGSALPARTEAVAARSGPGTLSTPATGKRLRHVATRGRGIDCQRVGGTYRRC